MKSILITAFEPFGGRETNASAEVLKRLPEAIGGYHVRKQTLPVVFGQAAEMVQPEGASYLFLLGEAGRETVTPETTARNLRSARIPDNEGNQPENERIAAGGPEEYHTILPVGALVERMAKEGHAITISHDAGQFVCNDTFYLTGTRHQGPVEFIHVPVAATEETAETVRRFIELAVSHAPEQAPRDCDAAGLTARFERGRDGGDTGRKGKREMTELIMEIRVKCEEPISVTGAKKKITMIPFTGEATGAYFRGQIIGPGVDTQKIEKDGTTALSARYMLEGADYGGNPCRIFIENQGFWGGAFVPAIVTDSPLLSDWESANLSATVEGIPGGVLVSVFKKTEDG